MMTVTIYTRPGCGPCIATKSALTRAGVPFTERAGNALPASILAEAQARSLEMTAPLVIVTDDSGIILDLWSGLRPDKIDALRAVAA